MLPMWWDKAQRRRENQTNKAKSSIQFRFDDIMIHLRKYIIITNFKISLISYFCPDLNIVDLCWWGLHVKNFLYYHCEWHCLISFTPRERKQWRVESVRMRLQSNDPVPHGRLTVPQWSYRWAFQGYLWIAETSNKYVIRCL